MSKLALDIVGIGAINLDLIVPASATSREVGARFEVGEELQVDAERLNKLLPTIDQGAMFASLGGSAFNTLRALGALDPQLRLGFVGVRATPRLEGVDIDPRLLDSAIADARLDTKGLHETASPMARCLSILDEDGERSLLPEVGANAELAAFIDTRFDALVDYVASARLVHVTSFLDADTTDAVCRLVVAATERRGGLLVSVDPGHVWAAKRRERSVMELLEACNYLFVNRRELKLLSESDPVADDDAMAQALLDTFGQTTAVVVLKQPSGARVFWRRGAGLGRDRVERKTLDDEIIDATGAGDVFAAGALALLLSAPLQVRLGARLGVDLARQTLLTIGTTGYAEFSVIADAFAPRADPPAEPLTPSAITPTLDSPQDRDAPHRSPGDTEGPLLVITALSDEYDAVVAALPEVHHVPRRNVLPAHARTILDATEGPRDVIVCVLPRMGTMYAGFVAVDAIDAWSPSLIVLAGIAAGVGPDIRNGDVIVAERVVESAAVKVLDDRMLTHGNKFPAADAYLQSVQTWKGANERDWSTRLAEGALSPGFGERGPSLRFGAVASSDEVVASEGRVAEIRAYDRKLVGIEMEALGIASACLHRIPHTPFLVIKGVSDDGTRAKDDRWRLFACEASASLVINLAAGGWI